MGIGDFVGGVVDGAKDVAGDVVDGAQDVAGNVVDGAQNLAGDVVGGAQQFASDPVGTVTGMFGGGDPSGNDGGSSSWPAWGHEEIRAMLDASVHPGTIGEGAHVWGERSREASDIMNAFTGDLRATVSGGWRGAAADAAMASLDPVDQWSASLNQAADYTTRLVDHSGSAVGQAKEMVPEPVSHNWGRTLGGFAVGGPLAAGVDAVAQDRAQEEARLEAVRIMTGVYSVPINENRAAVPTYPQLVDPTLQPPETSPRSGPSPGTGLSGAGPAGGGGAGGAPGGAVAQPPPAGSGLQGLPGGPDSPGAGQPTPGQATPLRPPLSGPGGGGSGTGVPPAASGVPGAPLMGPVGGAGTGAGAERAGRGFRGAGTGGSRAGRARGLGGLGGRAGAGAGGASGFGPRGSGGLSASAAEGRIGAGPGGVAAGGAGAAGRGGAGAAPMMGGGGGRGQGGDDEEHRRPSYLVETDDVFGDGRKVAPPVIGEDPPEHYR